MSRYKHLVKTWLASTVLLCAALFSSIVLAQSGLVRGSFGGDTGDGGNVQISFTCSGTPTCSGQYNMSIRDSGCSNTFSLSDKIVITGLNLSQPGPIQGTATLSNIDFNDTLNADGTCSIKPNTSKDRTFPYSGTWTGSAGVTTYTVIEPEGTFQFTGTLSRDSAAPVFPMVITGSVTPTVANINAAIQYRPQDVGRQGSVYVFALVPSAKVKGVAASAGTTLKGAAEPASLAASGCVLAQVSATGQVTAVASSSLQPYLSGVLSSQGASVSVLNNVSTPTIAGAVFYVGYGSSATDMLNNGINQNAVVVADAAGTTCQPQAPQTGWWWNAAQAGRGFTIEVSGNTLFMAGYLYDAAGNAVWTISAGPTSLDGSQYTGSLDSYSNGQTLTGTYKAPAAPTSLGTVTLNFSDARNGTLVWPGGVVPIVRFDDVIGSGNGTTPAFVPQNGWWWNASESGRGYFIEFKNNYVFLAGYMYAATTGLPLWYIAQGAMASPTLYQSGWTQYANGQTMTGAYKPATALPTAGPMSIQFQDATHATMTMPDGRQVAITRYVF